MLKASILFVFILSCLSSSIFAKQDPKLCARELEGIVFRPPNAAYDYLKAISEDLKIETPLLFTEQNKSIIESFIIKYQVFVFVSDAMGNILPYTVADANYRPPFPPQIQAQIIALGLNLKVKNVGYYQIYTQGNGFFSSKLPANFYSFEIKNRLGQIYIFYLAAPKGRINNICY